ncbi:Chordin-like protein 1 [Frankliniella fusca]|uniref:Chordin-like protein 1 n=1 Tax=Frankliniella fusca TaxID=407009 RepID=A0AAE1LMS7_9NEOP|nr:Chordin-like protein 1 [Frankliniella fusca]
MSTPRRAREDPLGHGYTERANGLYETLLRIIPLLIPIGDHPIQLCKLSWRLAGEGRGGVAMNMSLPRLVGSGRRQAARRAEAEGVNHDHSRLGGAEFLFEIRTGSSWARCVLDKDGVRRPLCGITLVPDPTGWTGSLATSWWPVAIGIGLSPGQGDSESDERVDRQKEKQEEK